MPGQTAIFFTGGTIGMRHDAGGRVVPALKLDDLLSELPADLRRGRILPVQWADLPSSHMAPELMLKLAGDVQNMLDQERINGTVITHGTDVLEETAFMLDLLLDSPKPVVVTGAMRSHDEAGYDGLRTLAGAVLACLHPLPPGCGVAVLMADRLFAAREAVKVHSMSVDSFAAPGAGPIGSCVAGGVQFFRSPIRHRPLKIKRLETNVPIISMYPGADGSLLACARSGGAKGIVVQALGAGNVPPEALPELRAAVNSGLPVVLTSRCVEGGVWPVYGYKGGADELRDLGLILGGNLPANKARLLLMLALGQDGPEADNEKARKVFEEFPN